MASGHSSSEKRVSCLYDEHREQCNKSSRFEKQRAIFGIQFSDERARRAPPKDWENSIGNCKYIQSGSYWFYSYANQKCLMWRTLCADTCKDLGLRVFASNWILKAIDSASRRYHRASVLAGQAGYSLPAFATNSLRLSGRKAGFSNFPKLPIWCELW